MITVELVGGPADGWKGPQIDFRVVLPIPAECGPHEGVYRLQPGQIPDVLTGFTLHAANRVLLYDYCPPERTGA